MDPIATPRINSQLIKIFHISKSIAFIKFSNCGFRDKNMSLSIAGGVSMKKPLFKTKVFSFVIFLLRRLESKHELDSDSTCWTSYSKHKG